MRKLLSLLSLLVAFQFELLSLTIFCARTATVFEYPTDNYAQSLAQLPHFFLFGDPNPRYGNNLHVAEDIRVSSPGMAVYATAAGRVMLARPWRDCPNWGYILVIEHTLLDGSKVCSIYAHLDRSTVVVEEGQDIIRPREILGQTGNYPCWDEHLHFAIYRGPFGASKGIHPPWLVICLHFCFLATM